MKIYVLLLVVLLALTGCSTTYKGTIDGASNQQESKKGRSVVHTETGIHPHGIAIN